MKTRHINPLQSKKTLWVMIMIGIFIICLSSVSVKADILNGTTLYYSLDESSGNAIERIYGFWNGSNIFSVNQNVAGKVNLGAEFNTTGNYFNVTNGTGGELSNQFSVNYWMNVTNNSGNRVPMTKSLTGGATGWDMDWQSAQNRTRLSIATGSGVVTVQAEAQSVKPLVWNMITFIGNGVNLTAFVNGVWNGSSTYDGTYLTNSSLNLKLGTDHTLGNGLVGRLDEIAFWNRSISFAEVTQLYNSGQGLSLLGGNVLIVLNSPSGLVLSPYNATFNASLSVSTAFNLTNASLYLYNSSNALINNSNVSLSGISNTSIFNLLLPSGFYTWNVFGCRANATDHACNFAGIGNATLNVSSFIENSQTFNSPVYETTTETFYLNISFDSSLYSVAGANLTYNGTIYGGSASTSGNNAIISRAITIPSVSSQQNKSFFWTITLQNATSSLVFNSLTKTQVVNKIDIDNCAVNTIQILNYSFYDENTRTFLNVTNASAMNITSSIYVKLTGDLTGSVFSYYANSSTTNPLRVCIANSLVNGTPYRLDSDVQFTAKDHVTEYHIVESVTINNTNIPIQYNLYDLLITHSTEFLITFKDSNLIAVPGALVEITRQYLDIGQFLPVEISRTDFDGRTIGHFVLNDQVYTINVRKNGNLLATYSNVRVYCSSTDCRLNLNQPSTSINPSAFLNYLNVSFITNYTEPTRTYNFVFSTTDGQAKTFNLTIFLADNYGNNTLCSNSVTSFSGTLSCVIPSTINGTAIAKVNVNGLQLYTEHFYIDSLQSSGLNPIRYIFAFILVITLPLIALASPSIALIFFVVGMIFASLLAFIDLGGLFGSGSAIIWFVIAIGILIWKINKGSSGG